MDTYAGWPEFESGSYFISSSQPCFPSCPIKAKTLKNKQLQLKNWVIYILLFKNILQLYFDWTNWTVAESAFMHTFCFVQHLCQCCRGDCYGNESYVTAVIFICEKALDCERNICITSLNCGIIFSEIVMHRVTVLYLIKMISAFD